nr:MAG TPA: hypothetical protein [Caudoviricetes sp.]
MVCLNYMLVNIICQYIFCCLPTFFYCKYIFVVI